MCLNTPLPLHSHSNWPPVAEILADVRRQIFDVCPNPFGLNFLHFHALFGKF